MLHHPAWNLILLGGLIVVIGLIWLATPSAPWLGRLPGDIVIDCDNFKFYFPLTTCVLVSLLLTGVLWLIRYFSQ